MRALTLAVYDLKRLLRHRGLTMSLFALPVVVGVARIVFPRSSSTLACAWSCPLACAALTGVVFYVRGLLDRASGLSEALRCSPASSNALLASRVIAPAFVFALQMAILGAIIAIRS